MISEDKAGVGAPAIELSHLRCEQDIAPHPAVIQSPRRRDDY
jgi:hypothetical protein